MPLIGATGELLLFTIAPLGDNQSEAWILGSFWGQWNCCHPLLHQTSEHIIFFFKFLCFISYLNGNGPVASAGDMRLRKLILN